MHKTIQSNKFSRRSVMKYLAGAAAACPTCMSVAAALASEQKKGDGAAAAEDARKAHWTYDGDSGPEHWGDLSPANRVCSLGFQQSPIDLAHATPARPGTMGVKFQPSSLRIVNNGHTIQCNTDAGSGMTLDGQPFKLLQFHFHHPSEHALDGKRFDMEAHYVHINDAGNLAVLGVFITPGAENSLLAPIWQHMPKQKGPEKKVASITIDPAKLLPANREYYRYFGSLTTPPCSEIVVWSVFAEPVEASSGQIAQFAKMFPMTARPLQGLHRRQLLLGS